MAAAAAAEEESMPRVPPIMALVLLLPPPPAPLDITLLLTFVLGEPYNESWLPPHELILYYYDGCYGCDCEGC